MGDKPFTNIEKDFPELNKLCEGGLSTKGSGEFGKVTSGIYSVLSKWEKLMKESASQDKNGSALKNYSSIKLECNENEYDKSFEILERERLDALNLLRSKDNAYLITSLILTGSVSPKAMKSGDTIAYDTLKKYVEKTLGKYTAVLNEPRKASMALLMWNTIANMHLESIEAEILKNQLLRKEASIKDSSSLINELYNKMVEIQAGGGMVIGGLSGVLPKRRRARSPGLNRRRR